jgi:hypothetical protein
VIKATDFFLIISSFYPSSVTSYNLYSLLQTKALSRLHKASNFLSRGFTLELVLAHDELLNG